MTQSTLQTVYNKLPRKVRHRIVRSITPEQKREEAKSVRIKSEILREIDKYKNDKKNGKKVQATKTLKLILNKLNQ